MAEKQFALSGSRDDEIFADDDPLAELARIVGFEPRPSAPVAPIVRQEPAMEPRPPEFALEDELMREFALYDAPRLDPVNEILLDVPDDAKVEEQFSAPQQGLSYVEPQTFTPAIEPEAPIAAAPAHEDTYPFEELLEAELASDVPAAEYESLLSGGDDVAPAAVGAEPYQQHGDYAGRSDYAQQAAYVREEPVAAAPATEAQQFALEDLADELEQSIEEIESTPVSAGAHAAPFGEQPRFRLPLANFNLPSRQAAQVIDAPTPVVPVSLDAAPDVPQAREPSVDIAADLPDLDFDLDVDQLAAEYMEGVSPSVAVVAPKASVEEHQPAAMPQPNDFDDLLADVERYSIPVLDPAVTPRFEPADELFPEVAAPAVARPIAYSTIPAATPEPVLDNGEPEFEFDLDGIELELSDMSFDDPALSISAPERIAVAPPLAAPIVAASAHSIWDAPIAAAADAAPQAPARPSYQDNSEVFAHPAAVSVRHHGQSADASAPLPFDPSLIADSEENLETLAELEVPALPVIEKEEPVALQPEYDIDIDAEMASLFETTPAHESPANVAAGAASWAAGTTASTKTPQKSVDDFDEFEKALEEDFRQTLTEPYDNDLNVAKMTLDPALTGAGRGRSRSLKGLLLASSLIVVGGAGAFGAYNWLFGGASGASSNGPVVISADKEPVKVVPEDKGGKTVPNQDKAVYDRVAGASAGDPKQEKLVSSTEEPIDVVQKTLIPENLPLEGAEDDIGLEPTPAGETEDARLLPSDAGQDVAAKENTPAGVAARKVRSMIVKPDGTIVARETPAEPAEVEASVAEMPKPGAAETDIVASGKPALAQSTQQPVNTAPATDLRASAPAEEPVNGASDQALSDVASSNVGGATPVRTVKTNTVGDQAPLPETRPAEQPVNVVGTVTDKGNVRDAQAAGGQTQVASIAPGTYFVQVASLPSEAEAQKSYESLSRKFGNVIGGRGVDIKKAEIAGKGTFYRVRIPGGTKDEAAALCEKYRAVGGSCLIAK